MAVVSLSAFRSDMTRTSDLGGALYGLCLAEAVRQLSYCTTVTRSMTHRAAGTVVRPAVERLVRGFSEPEVHTSWTIRISLPSSHGTG